MILGGARPKAGKKYSTVTCPGEKKLNSTTQKEKKKLTLTTWKLSCDAPNMDIHAFYILFKGTSGGPRHCIWTPAGPLKLSCYLALDPPKGDSKHMTSEIECFHRYWNSASRTPRYPLKY